MLQVLGCTGVGITKWVCYRWVFVGLGTHLLYFLGLLVLGFVVNDCTLVDLQLDCYFYNYCFLLKHCTTIANIADAVYVGSLDVTNAF